MSSEHPWGQKKCKVRDRDWTMTYWQVSNVDCDIDRPASMSINNQKSSHYVVYGTCTPSMAHQPSISTSRLMHRSLMCLQYTNNWNGNMKTLPVSRDIRKGSLSVPVSIEGKTWASDHSKSLMTEFRAIPHLFYCLPSDLSSPFVLSFSVECRKDSIKAVASKLIMQIRSPSRVIDIVHQT